MRRGARIGAMALALCLGAEAGHAARTAGGRAGAAIAAVSGLGAAVGRAPVFVEPGPSLLAPSAPARPAMAPIAIDLLGVVAVGPTLDAATEAETSGPRLAGRRGADLAAESDPSPRPREVRCSALAAEDCYAASWSDRLVARVPDARSVAWLAASPFALFSVGALGWGLAQRRRRKVSCHLPLIRTHAPNRAVLWS